MPLVRLTKKAIDSVVAPKSGQEFYRDTDLQGFALRVLPSGRRTFIIERRQGKKVHRVTIGTFPEITADQARKKAHQLISEMVLGGETPAVTKRDRELELITIDQVFSDYIRDKRLSDGTVRGYESALRLAFPDWRSQPLRDLDRDMVAVRFKELSQRSPSRANHHMRFLGALFHYAMRRYRYANDAPVFSSTPVDVLGDVGIWNRDLRRKSYIKPSDLPAWYQAVVNLGSVVPNPNDLIARDYFPLVLFTGLRRDEAGSLTVARCNFNERYFWIPGAQTKNGEDHYLPMSDYVHDLLKRRAEQSTNGYIFPSRGESGHITSLDYQIKKIYADSGVGFTTHDLRRTLTTVVGSLDISQYAVKRLLNHKVGDVTEGYIVSDVERLREPLRRVADALMRMISNLD